MDGLAILPHSDQDGAPTPLQVNGRGSSRSGAAAFFDRLSAEDARQIVETKQPAYFAENFAFVKEGDHYQTGKGFIGPRTTATDEVSKLESDEIEKRFTPDDIIGEVIGRRTDGVLSKEPHWSVALKDPPKDDEQVPDDDRLRMADIEAALTQWWDAQGLHETLKDLADSVSAFQRAYLRFVVPAVLLSDDVRLRGLPPEDLLRLIHVEVVEPDKATLHTDPDTLLPGGVVAFYDRGDPGLAGTEVDDDAQQLYVELHYALAPGAREEEAVTVLRVIDEAPGTDVPYELALGGHLLLFEARERKLFLKEQVRKQQKALNTASTEMRVVNDDEGFKVRILSNIKPPFREVRDPQTGEVRREPVAVALSPNSILFAEGQDIRDDLTGETKGKATPGVHSLDAADPENYLKEMRARRSAILRMAKQAYVEITGDATASGESRIQAMQDFLLDVRTLKAEIDRAGKWLLETAWRLALVFAGQAEDDHEYKVVFDCKLTLPSLPAGVMDAKLRQMDKGVLSRETVMSESGVDDIDAEQTRIAASHDHALALAKQVAETLRAWQDAGLRLTPELLQYLKVPEELAELILQGDLVPPPDEDEE